MTLINNTRKTPLWHGCISLGFALHPTDWDETPQITVIEGHTTNLQSLESQHLLQFPTVTSMRPQRAWKEVVLPLVLRMLVLISTGKCTVRRYRIYTALYPGTDDCAQMREHKCSSRCIARKGCGGTRAVADSTQFADQNHTLCLTPSSLVGMLWMCIKHYTGISYRG